MTLLRENCLACHNPEKKKGKLDLTTHDAALHGGEDGPAFIAGKSGESRMISRALASDADPHMPPKGQLTKDEIASLALWIDAGAAWMPRSSPARSARPRARSSCGPSPRAITPC